MDRRFDLLWAAIASLTGVAIAIASLVTPSRRVLDLVGPFGLPLALGVAVALLGAVQAYRAVRALREGRVIDEHEGTEDDDRYPSSSVRGTGFIVGTFVYIALLQPVGYLIMTPLATGAGLWSLGYRRVPKMVAVTLGYTLATFWLFSQVMSVPLPVGILRGPLVDAGLISRFR